MKLINALSDQQAIQFDDDRGWVVFMLDGKEINQWYKGTGAQVRALHATLVSDGTVSDPADRADEASKVHQKDIDLAPIITKITAAGLTAQTGFVPADSVDPATITSRKISSYGV